MIDLVTLAKEVYSGSVKNNGFTDQNTRVLRALIVKVEKQGEQIEEGNYWYNKYQALVDVINKEISDN